MEQEKIEKNMELMKRVETLETDNQSIKKINIDLELALKSLIRERLSS